jgi:F-type H+-transporting ATPase subunit b
MSRVALPRISSILEERRKRVEADLAEAQRRKDESDATILAGEEALADARARAQTLANETHEKAAAAAEARRKEVDAKLASRVAEAKRPLPLRDRRPSRRCMVLRARPRPQSSNG